MLQNIVYICYVEINLHFVKKNVSFCFLFSLYYYFITSQNFNQFLNFIQYVIQNFVSSFNIKSDIYCQMFMNIRSFDS